MSMKRALLLLPVLALAACGAPQDSSLSASGNAESDGAPAVPAALQVPAGNELAFHLDAIGVQIYVCNGTSWVFQAPAAALYNDGGHLTGSHYAGPTWRIRESSVVGAKVAAATVDATAIPWLLLKAVSHAGNGPMGDITYVQRLSTAGGLAPASGCDASTAGTEADVDYTATYWFYEAAGSGD